MIETYLNSLLLVIKQKKSSEESLGDNLGCRILLFARVEGY